MNMWFDKGNTEVARMHKAAYEKSLKSNRPIKVHAGSYYYKGYAITNDGGAFYPWNWKEYTSNETMDKMGWIANEEVYPAKTKEECITQIDLYTEDNG